MIISELWSDKDEAAGRALVAAVAAGDLVGGLLAIEGASEGRAKHARASLERWGDRVSVRSRFGSLAARVDVLRSVLVDELDIEGDAGEYHDVRNSLLTHVMDRRRGMPILVSCIWMAVGRLGGLEVDGLALPGHFVVRIGGPIGVVVDPYDRGEVLSLADCRKLVRDGAGAELSWDDAWLEPASLSATLERVLRNLAGSYARVGDVERLYRAVRKLGGLRPDLADVQLDLARVSEKLGAGVAEAAYAGVLSKFAGTREAKIAGDRLSRVRPGSRLPN